MRILYLLLLASFGANAGSSFVIGKDLQSALDAHSRAANLSPLKSSSPDQLRVWGNDYMGRRITGYAISESGALICNTKYTYADGTIEIDRARCRPWPRGHGALDDMDNLLTLDGRQWDCPMFDGGGFYIEGVRNGKHFALRVSNPDACDDKESAAVINLLRKL